MTRYEIEQSITKEEEYLEIAINCDEETACKIFNADSKADAIAAIDEQLDFYRGLLQSDQESVRNYEKTADMPYLCW